jgi:hypothetical protein
VKKLVLLTITILLLALSALACAGESSQTESSQDPKYQIFFLGDSYARIVAISFDHGIYDNTTSVRISNTGHGDALYAGMQELENKYILEETTPINYYQGYGSLTKELLVKIRLKN